MKEPALPPVRASRRCLYLAPSCRFSSARIVSIYAETIHTGNSKPRIFPTVTETTPATTKKRATANTGAKRGPKATTTKAAKPVGVTKKKAPAKKTSVATKVKYFGIRLWNCC